MSDDSTERRDAIPTDTLEGLPEPLRTRLEERARIAWRLYGGGG